MTPLQELNAQVHAANKGYAGRAGRAAWIDWDEWAAVHNNKPHCMHILQCAQWPVFINGELPP
jgi:hypothetical protein